MYLLHFQKVYSLAVKKYVYYYDALVLRIESWQNEQLVPLTIA